MNPQLLSEEKFEDKIEWSALEYEEKDRSPDWFWALGVIIVASTITAVIYGNYFFAFLIILSGLLLWFFAIRRPDIIYYELNDIGLKIRTRVYPYDAIKSFWVQIHAPTLKNGEEELKPLLFIKSERLFMPIISVPVGEEWAEEIHNMMIKHSVMEEEMHEHVSEKIMEFLGF